MDLLTDEKGSVILLFALTLVAICGFMGLVLDAGNMYIQHEKIQDAVDAACLAGAQELPDTDKAQAEAVQYAEANGVEASALTLQFADDNTKISASASRDVKLFFMPLFGFNSMVVNASSAAVQGPAGCFNYTLFSGSKDDSLVLNGNQEIDGSVHTNQAFSATGGDIIITGVCEAVGSIGYQGGIISIPYSRPYSYSVSMPDYTAQVEQEAQSAGQIYNSSHMYNGNNINVSGSIYIDGRAILNGNNITGAGAILTTGDIIINGNCINTSTNDQVCLYSNQDITINGTNLQIDGILYAPKGRITINGSNITINGKVVADTVEINGTDITIKGTDNVVSLPCSGSRLIQ